MANIDQHEAELEEDPLDLENVSWTSSGRGPAMTSGSEPDASLAVNSSWSKKRKSSNDSGSRRKKFPSSFSEDQEEEPGRAVPRLRRNLRQPACAGQAFQESTRQRQHKGSA